MRNEAASFPIWRAELWHGTLVAALGAVLAPLGLVEPLSLLLGAVFMGVNFLLLALGIRWILTPFAGRGRVRSGVLLLLLKLVLFLGLIGFFFFKFPFDAMSFALGVSCLLVALVVQGLGSRRLTVEAAE